MSLPLATYQAYCDILKEELRLAMGCTEPIAIAYGAAVARGYMTAEPMEIMIGLSGNIIKNTKSVVVPATGGMHGIPAAVVAGTVSNRADLSLEVLSSLTEEDVPKMKDMLLTCSVDVKELDTSHIFEILLNMKNENEEVKVRLLDGHTNLVYVEKNGQVLVKNEQEEEDGGIKTDRSLLTVEDIVAFADEVNLDDVRELLNRQISCNMAIAEVGIKENYGACIGQTIYKKGNCSISDKARAYAAAGSDARMNGCELPVCIISGSGNQGITASVPVVVYARELGKSEEELATYIEEMLKQREPYYMKAKHVFDVDLLNTREKVCESVRLLKEAIKL
jgi:L-cysteine desulfidase